MPAWWQCFVSTKLATAALPKPPRKTMFKSAQVGASPAVERVSVEPVLGRMSVERRACQLSVSPLGRQPARALLLLVHDPHAVRVLWRLANPHTARRAEQKGEKFMNGRMGELDAYIKVRRQQD
jgi:hypothetical protein